MLNWGKTEMWNQGGLSESTEETPFLNCLGPRQETFLSAEVKADSRLF